MQQVLSRVKDSLRITHDKFDETVFSPMIESCRGDLLISGVAQKVAYDENHMLVERAIIHYCHINFPLGGDAKEIERHERTYSSLKNSLAMVGDDLSFKTF